MLAVYGNNKFFIDLMIDFLVHSLPQSSSCFPIVSLGFFCRFTLLSCLTSYIFNNVKWMGFLNIEK